jgi:hypothetical protein
MKDVETLAMGTSEREQTGVDDVDVYTLPWIVLIPVRVGQSEGILVGKLVASAYAIQSPRLVRSGNTFE